MERFIKFSLVLYAFCYPLAGLAFEDSEDEFKIKRQYEMDKIEDFYIRLNELERMEADRLSGESEMKKYRKEVSAENEAARQAFIKERKTKPKEDPTAWERELLEQKRQHELERKAFVKRRDEMNRALKSVGKIPEEDEYDIDLNYVEEGL